MRRLAQLPRPRSVQLRLVRDTHTVNNSASFSRRRKGVRKIYWRTSAVALAVGVSCASPNAKRYASASGQLQAAYLAQLTPAASANPIHPCDDSLAPTNCPADAPATPAGAHSRASFDCVDSTCSPIAIAQPAVPISHGERSPQHTGIRSESAHPFVPENS